MSPNRKKDPKVMPKSHEIRNFLKGFGDLWAVGLLDEVDHPDRAAHFLTFTSSRHTQSLLDDALENDHDAKKCRTFAAHNHQVER